MQINSFSLDAQSAIKMISGTTFQCKETLLHSGGDMAAKLARCVKGNFKEISPLKLGVDRQPDGSLDLDDLTNKLAARGLEKGSVVSVSAKLGPKPKKTLKPQPQSPPQASAKGQPPRKTPKPR